MQFFNDLAVAERLLARAERIVRSEPAADLKADHRLARAKLRRQQARYPEAIDLAGGAADLIFAAGGIDTLRGGGGADLFQYRATSDSANGASDFILDFEFGSDRIDLAFIDANSGAGGDQAFTFIGGQGFHNVASELRATRQGDGNDWLIEADVNGDGVADLRIQVTTTTPGSLGDADFLL
jgi:hypothetical protein